MDTFTPADTTAVAALGVAFAADLAGYYWAMLIAPVSMSEPG